MCLNVIKVTLPRYGLLPPLTEDYLSFLNVRLESSVTTQQCHSCYLYIVMLNCKIWGSHSIVSEDSLFWDMITVSLDSSTRKCCPPTQEDSQHSTLLLRMTWDWRSLMCTASSWVWLCILRTDCLFCSHSHHKQSSLAILTSWWWQSKDSNTQQ